MSEKSCRLQLVTKAQAVTVNVLVWKRLPIETLRLAGVVETEIGRGHDDVINDATGRDQIDKPSQDYGRSAGNRKKAQEWEDHGDCETVDRDTVLGAASQD